MKQGKTSRAMTPYQVARFPKVRICARNVITERLRGFQKIRELHIFILILQGTEAFNFACRMLVEPAVL